MQRRTRWLMLATLGLGIALGYAAALVKSPFAQSTPPAPQAPESKQAPVSAARPISPDKPNIIFMLTDNLGYGEVGCYGGGILRGRRRRASTSSPRRGRGCSISTSRPSVRRAARPS